MTVGTGKRQYRACQRCRKRKSRCDLSSIGEVGQPPCLDCYRTGQECTLPTSRRGGNYAQFRKPRMTRQEETSHSTASPNLWAASPGPTPAQRANNQDVEDEPESDPFNEELRNPSDALQILTRSTDQRRSSVELVSPSMRTNSRINGSRFPRDHASQGDAQSKRSSQWGTSGSLDDYALVARGLLQPAEVREMVQIYATNYHPYLPVVPGHILIPQNVDRVARDEAFLLTIILTIASKDDFDLNVVHHHCCQHTKRLLLDVLLALPSTFGVGTVEGLLVLSEWLPYISFNSNQSLESAKGNFPEDSTAWSLIGQAIRHAYLLRLDMTSFREDATEEKRQQIERKRIAWTFVYLADRQISVRMGQSFWSRGSSLSTKFTAKDFSSLQPPADDADDYASILLSTIEMTQLLHNVHDIMYSSRPRTLSMISTGDYNRYLDDFHKGLLVWNSTWEGLSISPKLKSTLVLMREYLNLYANAFSFQAVITRSSGRGLHVAGSQPNKKAALRRNLFPGGVMASPDGRYILDAVRSAKIILQTFNAMEPDVHLRYMPFRYYLYGIYAAVFLFKAEAFGALVDEKEGHEVLLFVKDFVTIMSKAAVSEHHVGWRYSQLLATLYSDNQSTDNPSDLAQDRAVLPRKEHRSPVRSDIEARFSTSKSIRRDSPESNTLNNPLRPVNGHFQSTQAQNIAGGGDMAFSGYPNSSVPFQLSDFNFPTTDPSWIDMSLDARQNFLTLESPFALNEMWALPQFDDDE